MEQPARRILGASREPEWVQGRRSRRSLRQEHGDGSPPGGSVLGKRAAPAANGTQRWQAIRRTLALGRLPRSIVLEAHDDHLLNDGQQVMAEAQQKTGQKRERGMASLAEPALDPNTVDLGLIFGLTRVEAVTDENMGCAAGWATLRAGKDDLLKMRDVILDSAAKIQYDGHLFLLNPTPRTAVKQRSRGRVLPFRQSERPSLPDFAPCRQPGLAFCQWPPGDWLSPGTPCSNPTPGLLLTKKPPTMDDLTLNADLDHHLFKTNSRESRPIIAAAYSIQLLT